MSCTEKNLHTTDRTKPVCIQCIQSCYMENRKAKGVQGAGRRSAEMTPGLVACGTPSTQSRVKSMSEWRREKVTSEVTWYSPPWSCTAVHSRCGERAMGRDTWIESSAVEKHPASALTSSPPAGVPPRLRQIWGRCQMIDLVDDCGHFCVDTGLVYTNMAPV